MNKKDKKGKISVLIPTYNGSKEIINLITKLFTQEIEKTQELEVIIVDSSSTDGTVELVNSVFDNVKVEVIPNHMFDHGGTRNYLATKASGDYLLFMTQDAVPKDENLIKNLILPLRNEDVVISYARQIPKKDANFLEAITRSFNYPEKTIVKSKDDLDKLGIKTFFNSNVCSMYKKEVFTKYGGFPEKIILNEDMILSSKVILDGKKVSYSAKAEVLHSHNYNLKQQFKRYFDIGMAFEETSFLLKYASNEKEGMKLVRYQFSKLMRNGKVNWLFYMFIENCIKFIGYNFGKRHHFFNKKFKKRFSAYMK